jgi:hypothetical protein
MASVCSILQRLFNLLHLLLKNLHYSTYTYSIAKKLVYENQFFKRDSRYKCRLQIYSDIPFLRYLYRNIKNKKIKILM